MHKSEKKGRIGKTNFVYELAMSAKQLLFCWSCESRDLFIDDWGEHYAVLGLWCLHCLDTQKPYNRWKESL